MYSIIFEKGVCKLILNHNLSVFCLASFLFMSCGDNESVGISKVYVTYQTADKVGVFNGESGKLIREVDVDIASGTMDNPHYVVLDEEQGYWYVTLISSGYVLKFDLQTDVMVDSVEVGELPALMSVLP